MSLTIPATEIKVNGTAIATQNILNVQIHLGCTRETNSFVVVVNNSNSDYYSGQYAIGGAKEFTKGHSVTIKIKRGEITSDTNYLITGNLETLEYTDQKEEYQYRDIVILKGRCSGQRLFNRKYNGDLIEDVGIGYQNFNRWGSTEDLSGDAASAQKVVAVDDASTFDVGDTVNIYDDTPQIEENVIADVDVDTNELTMENNLSNAYTTANNALVAYMRSGDASSLVAYLIDNYTANQDSVYLSHIRTTDDLASNATQYEKTIIVTDGSKFTAGRLIIIKDDNNWEYNRILSISTNTLTLYNPLLQNYTTAANCIVGQSLIYVSSTDFTKMEITYETVFDIIKFIADTTSSTGFVIGYDARIEYDGKFSFRSLNGGTESYSLSEECQMERYIDDASRIKNQIRVFGKQDKPYPLATLDGQSWSDIWTESIPVDRGQVASNVTAGDDYVRVSDASYFSVDDKVSLIDSDLTKGEIKTITRIVDGVANSNLTGDASSGQKVVNVVDGSVFTVGDIVTISDDTPLSEENRIGSISTNELTMENNLANTYTTAQNALVTQIDDVVYLDDGWDNAYTTAKNSVLFTLGDNGGWAYAPLTQWDVCSLGYESTSPIYEGNKSLEVAFNAARSTMFIYIILPAGVNFDEYKKFYSKIRFNNTAPDYMFMWLWDTSGTSVSTSRMTGIDADEWHSIELNIGSAYDDEWIGTTDINWENIQIIGFFVAFSAPSSDDIHIDRTFINGKRWGGISEGGLAEDSTSQSTYGVKEHVVINDGLLSDTECEAKAQSLLLYYKASRTTIELETKTLDLVDYPIIPGNKVPVNLPLHSISGNYRIDSCDINCNADDNELTFKFTLETTPPKVADYLYYIYKKLGGLERYGINK